MRIPFFFVGAPLATMCSVMKNTIPWISVFAKTSVTSNEHDASQSPDRPAL
jgi:hypothetical protein